MPSIHAHPIFHDKMTLMVTVINQFFLPIYVKVKNKADDECYQDEEAGGAGLRSVKDKRQH